MNWMKQGRRSLRLLSLLMLLLACNTAFTHPDLVLQIEALDQQLVADPENVELLCKRGDLYRRHKEFDQAAKDFERARFINPGLPLVDFLEAKLLLDTRDPQAAAELLTRYLSLRPAHSFAWVLRGKAHIRMGEAGAGAADFSSAISSSPRPSPELYRLQLLSLAAQGTEKEYETLAATTAALEVFPYEPRLLGLGVDIALSYRNLDAASEYLSQLPEQLRTLPQWAERIQTVQCLDTEGSDLAPLCLEQASARLQEQIEVFLEQT
ncbi:MAG TPA: tetratricopeptide repeat protein [Xanthomonadales bacterium]|nr:tetratricopeptide repeat protein [Xanthomonadales bacterium]